MSEGRALVCVFCGEGFGYEGETPDEATLIAAICHEDNCPKSPYKAEIEALKEQLSTERVLAIFGRDLLARMTAERDRLEKALEETNARIARLQEFIDQNTSQDEHTRKEVPIVL